MNIISQMFTLQQELNDSTNGTKWIKGITQEGREITWNRCIYMEVVEAIDSFNWKHWKDINANADWDNAQVEIVDIWHFIMSEAIFLKQTKYAEQYLNNPVTGERNEAQLLLTLEKMLQVSVTAKIEKSTQEICQLIDLFFKALTHINMSVVELYKRYLVKNQLNTFRQKHGYKEGTYQKTWQGLEDNVVAFEIMEKQPEITPKALYEKLEAQYKLC
jgi:dimeric dUTPase (all-alpha-NTP-PPase superfamily)